MANLHKLGTEYLFYSTDKDTQGRFKDPYYSWLLGHEKDDKGKLTGRVWVGFQPPGELTRTPKPVPLATKETEFERPFVMLLHDEPEKEDKKKKDTEEKK